MGLCGERSKRTALVVSSKRNLTLITRRKKKQIHGRGCGETHNTSTCLVRRGSAARFVPQNRKVSSKCFVSISSFIGEPRMSSIFIFFFEKLGCISADTPEDAFHYTFFLPPHIFIRSDYFFPLPSGASSTSSLPSPLSPLTFILFCFVIFCVSPHYFLTDTKKKKRSKFWFSLQKQHSSQAPYPIFFYSFRLSEDGSFFFVLNFFFLKILE